VTTENRARIAVLGRIPDVGLSRLHEAGQVWDPGLLDLDNVVLVPHLGSATHETRDAMATLAARNVAAVLAGDRPLTPVG